MTNVTNKSLILLIMGLFLYTPCVYSQFKNDDERTFHGGLSLGTSFAQVDGDNFAGYHKVGIQAGGLLWIKLADGATFSMEMLYSQKGSRAALTQLPKLGNDLSTIITDYRIQLNYLEVPLAINYFDKQANHIGVGLSYNQLVRSRETYRDQFYNLFEQDARLYPFRKYDVNLQLNAGAHLKGGFFLSIRYAYSMLSIRNSYNYITGRPQQFNNLWTTRLMYMF